MGPDRAMYAAKDAARNGAMAVYASSSTWDTLKAMVTL